MDLGPPSLGWERLTPHRQACVPPPSFLRLSGQTRGRRVERKGGKFQGPGLESNKGSVFLPFHQQTSTQEEV